MQKVVYNNENKDISNKNAEIIDFKTIQKNASDNNDNKNIIEQIALECIKKADIKGSPEDIFNEYLKIRKQIKDKISSNQGLKLDNTDDDIYKKTVFDDYIICLEDGKKMKMLKRHLRTHYNMSFQEYKNKWNLPIDYPYVCKNHSKTRANIATRSKKR